MLLAEAVRQQVKLYHPNNPDLAFLGGIIMTDGKDVYSSEAMTHTLVLPRMVGQEPVSLGLMMS